MKKLLKIMFLGVIMIFSSCSEESQISNKNIDAKDEIHKKNTNTKFLICPIGRDERGLAGPGYWFPGVIGFNNCNQPNGECLYLETFGGGGVPIYTGKLISDDKLRLSFIDAHLIDHESLILDLSNEISMQGFDIEMMANFIETHYNFPNEKRLEAVLNQQILERLSLNENHQVYIQPGEYEINIDDENPNGYFDVDIKIE